MIEISDTVREQIREHAKESMPSEACGLLLVVQGEIEYFRCRNMSYGVQPKQFVMHPTDFIMASERGAPIAVVHSHPNMLPNASQADIVGCNQSGLPWFIIGYPTLLEAWIAPNDYEPPYLEREFAHGIMDCYTLAEDYYRRELGVILPDRAPYDWDAKWWENGKELYSCKNIEEAGFSLVNDAFKVHDLHFVQLRAVVPNHIAIQVENGAILHHVQDRLSEKVVYGGMWSKYTRYTYRHRSQR